MGTHIIKMYVVGTHLNCMDVDGIQMGTHKIYLYKEDKRYKGCNLKFTILLDCALIVVCAVIRLNTVYPKLFNTLTPYPNYPKISTIPVDKTKIC